MGLIRIYDSGKKQKLSKKQERQLQEYERWKQKHDEESAKALLKLRSIVPAPAQPKPPEQPTGYMKTLADRPPLPKPIGSGRVIKPIDPRADNYDELNQREQTAQQLIKEKQARTAPVYNKGGNQYFTEEMAKELASGSLRRRS